MRYKNSAPGPRACPRSGLLCRRCIQRISFGLVTLDDDIFTSCMPKTSTGLFSMVLFMVLEMVQRTNHNQNNAVKYQETIEWE